MSDAWGHLVGIVTVVLMATFLAIWLWAWRPRHTQLFDSLARIPLADTPVAADRKEHAR